MNFKATIESIKNADLLLILRGLAALGVVIYHSGVPRGAISPRDIDLTWLFYPDGGAAVMVFFTLSGYLIGKGFWTYRYKIDFDGVKKFLISRAKRILPVYYFITFVSIIFVFTPLLKREYFSTLWSILTFQFHYANHPEVYFSPAFWTLSVEVQFYILSPLIAFALYKFTKSRKVSLSIFVIVMLFSFLEAFAQLEQLPIFSTIYKSYLIKNIDTFLIGFTLYPILKNFQSLRDFFAKYWAIGIVSIVGLFFLTNFNAYYDRAYLGHFTPLIAAICTSIFILSFEALAFDRSYERKSYQLSDLIYNPIFALEFLGTLSYCIYLWHMTIMKTVFDIFPTTNPTRGEFIYRTGYVILFTLIMSIITHFTIEQPGAKLKFSNIKPSENKINQESRELIPTP